MSYNVFNVSQRVARTLNGLKLHYLAQDNIHDIIPCMAGIDNHRAKPKRKHFILSILITV